MIFNKAFLQKNEASERAEFLCKKALLNIMFIFCPRTGNLYVCNAKKKKPNKKEQKNEWTMNNRMAKYNVGAKNSTWTTRSFIAANPVKGDGRHF